MPRKLRRLQVRPHEVPLYHVTSRCIRKMMLTDEPGRKDFMLSWLKQLHAVYAVEVCRYALMGNHFHLIVRINLEMAKGWSDKEVAFRWAKLHPPRDWGHRPLMGEPLEQWIANLAKMPEAVAVIRLKLANLGQFMKEFKQRVAQIFNKADQAVGAFWQDRYTCVPLESESQLLACMTYVDLNPHAAHLCDKPENDPHTSLHESVKSREKEAKNRQKARLPATEPTPAKAIRTAQFAQETRLVEVVPDAERHSWTVPIGATSAHARQGLFKNLRLEDYLRLVDFIARKLRDGKAQLDEKVEDILKRTQVKTENWMSQVLGWLGGESLGSASLRLSTPGTA